MCYVSNDGTIHIAKEDIVVYKIGSSCIKEGPDFFECMYQNFKYKIKERQPEIELKPTIMIDPETDDDVFSVHEGYHSYVSLEYAERIWFNSFVSLSPNEKYWRFAKFIIPKGSSYMTDGNQYVSSCIIFHERLLEV